MFCAISGVTPEDPVVSRPSGLLFERRLIEKHIKEHDSCPVTKEPLSLDDLLPLKTNKAVKPRPPAGASIPGLLSTLQNEWDAFVLGAFAMEQQLHTVRQELSYALYQHDAATRVIARLKKERDEARAMLVEMERRLAMAPAQAPVAAPRVEMANGKRALEEEEAGGGGGAAAAAAAKRAKAGIVPEIVEEMTKCNMELSQKRKKRAISPSLAPIEAIERYTQLSSHPLHKTNKPGILSLDIHSQQDLIATAGVDAHTVVFDHSSAQIRATLAGHSKKVNCVKFLPRDDLLLTCSADKTTRVWKHVAGGGAPGGVYDCQYVLRDHTGEVKAATVHATDNYFVTASLDKTWAFYDVEVGVCLTQVSDPSISEGFTCASFHPDGLILGTGTGEALVRIWDVKSQANVAKFEGHTGPVVSISFSENGYFLATAASDGVKLWDLRKLKNFRTFSPYDADTGTNSVEFDFSGSYLAVGGADTRLLGVGSVKQEWNVVKTFPDLSGTGKITSVKFGPDAQYLAVATMDRNLRIFGPPPEVSSLTEANEQ